MENQAERKRLISEQRIIRGAILRCINCEQRQFQVFQGPERHVIRARLTYWSQDPNSIVHNLELWGAVAAVKMGASNLVLPESHCETLTGAVQLIAYLRGFRAGLEKLLQDSLRRAQILREGKDSGPDAPSTAEAPSGARGTGRTEAEGCLEAVAASRNAVVPAKTSSDEPGQPV
jgi:hypothetical protein